MVGKWGITGLSSTAHSSAFYLQPPTSTLEKEPSLFIYFKAPSLGLAPRGLKLWLTGSPVSAAEPLSSLCVLGSGRGAWHTAQSQIPIDCWMNSTSRGRLVVNILLHENTLWVNLSLYFRLDVTFRSQDSELKEELTQEMLTEAWTAWAESTPARKDCRSVPCLSLRVARISSISEVEWSVCTVIY